MSLKVLPALLLAIVIGFFLGCVPVLNEHLHWNLWYVIPISGLLFGCAVGGIQFGYCFKMNQWISGGVIAFLAVASLVGYVSVDYGIYTTKTISIEGQEEIPDGEYKLSELMSFWQYMKLNFGMETGAFGTMISYIADMIGAALGATGVLMLCREKYPFCLKCGRYKQREQKYEVRLVFEEQQVNKIFQKMDELIEAGIYRDIVGYCQQLTHDYKDSKGDVKISMDQRYCPMCLESTILGTVHQKSGGDWNEVEDLKFSFTSQPGEHVALGNMGTGQM